MKRNFTIFRRFAIVIFSLIAVMSMLFIIITYLATNYFHLASTQLLNKDVAAHIAEFTSPYSEKGINKAKADSVFKDAMVLSPSAEVYFLDTSGKVIAYHAEQSEILQWLVPLTPIKEYIATKGEKFIKGLDPKEPQQEKIFSASEVKNKNRTLGFIYVILVSKKSESIMELLYSNHVLRLALIAFTFVILLSLLVSFIYLKRLKKNFAKVLDVLERFERGDYNARFNLNKQNELEPVTEAFNKMADLLSSTINKLTHSQEERKNFMATITHDLRTPLTIARGYTETLLLRGEKDITPEELANYSQIIYAKMLQIENMVKQLFELSKMDAVEFKPHKEPFVLSEIVQESVNTFHLIATENKIDLRCTECLYHIWINADISMMERVVQNLVDNAIKSTPEGGNIHISNIVDNKHLVFQIENTGTPIPEDLLQWINNFKDEDNLLSNRPVKLGIGLLIVQKILHMHGSSLKAHTENNASNIFSFSLPIIDPVSKERI